MVFTCYGSGGSSNGGRIRHTNVFHHVVPGGAESKLFDIPYGTEHFHISLHAEQKGAFVLYDTVNKVDVLNGAKLNEVGNHADNSDVYTHAIVLNMIVNISTHVLPPAQTLSFKGPLPTVLQLRIRSESKDEQVFRLKYSYAPYKQGPMCEYGANSIGCRYYSQTAARELSVKYSSWLRIAYPDKEKAWTEFLDLDVQRTGAGSLSGVPYYRWCQVFALWPESSPRDCWKVYKFVTHGGLETNTNALYREQFTFLYDLADVNEFAKFCCNSLTRRYPTYQGFEKKWKALTASSSSAGAGNVVWNTCNHFPHAPTNKDDYLENFLDADGYQGLLVTDLHYCWRPRPKGPEQVPHWAARAGCVATFTYKGKTYNGCTKVDHTSGWCSMDAVYANRWQHCDFQMLEVGVKKGCHWRKNERCVPGFKYQGNWYKGCTETDHAHEGWCSTHMHYQGTWFPCTWHCPDGVDAHPGLLKSTTTPSTPLPWSGRLPGSTSHGSGSYGAIGTTTTEDTWHADDVVMVSTSSQASEGTTVSPLPDGCIWVPPAICYPEFKYEGVLYKGCTTVGHHSGWCSIDPEFKGQWKYCEKTCGKDAEYEGVESRTGGPTMADHEASLKTGLIAGGAIAGAGALAGIGVGIAHAVKAMPSQQGSTVGQQASQRMASASSMSSMSSAEMSSAAPNAGTMSSASPPAIMPRRESDAPAAHGAGASKATAPLSTLVLPVLLACVCCCCVIGAIAFLFARLRPKTRTVFQEVPQHAFEDGLPLVPQYGQPPEMMDLTGME